MKGRNCALNEVKQAVEALGRLKYQSSHKQTERRKGSAWICDFIFSFLLCSFSFLLLTILQMSPIFPLYPPHQAPSPSPPSAFTTLLSVSMVFAYMHICSLANLFQSPPHPSPLRLISLFHVSMPLVLFSLSAYFVHQSPHMNEII